MYLNLSTATMNNCVCASLVVRFPVSSPNCNQPRIIVEFPPDMAVKTPEQVDQQTPDYISRPNDLDPNQLLMHLPGGWRWVNASNTLGRSWRFEEPHDRIHIQITNKSGGPFSGHRAIISIFEVVHSGEDSLILGKRLGAIGVVDLRLVSAQFRATSFCVGFYSPNGSYYLTNERSKSADLPEYTVSVWLGRDSSKIPFWRDRLPFLRTRPNPRSHIEFTIPRLATG